MRRQGQASTVGRSPELDRLTTVVDHVRNGPAAVVVVSGPAGVGKTWLLDALRAQVEHAPDPFLVLHAVGHPAEHELPYAGLHQLVGLVIEAIDHLPGPQRAALHGALALSDLPPRDSFAAASGLLQLVTDLAERQPLLVVVDDVQWLDPASYQALVFVSRRLGADQVAVVLAGRDHPDPGLRPLADHLALAPLDDAEARAVVRAHRPEIAAATLDAIVQAAAGLPLALHEIPAGLTAPQIRGESPLPAPLPLGARLGDLYAGRLASLDLDAVLALLLVSLEPLGRADLDRALSQLDLSPDALEPAEAVGLVHLDGDGARVSHPTIAAAVQAAATDGASRRAHQVLAEVLADQPSRRAWHLDAVTDGPDDAVADAFATAADDAEARSAWLLAGQAHQAAARRCTDAARARSHLRRASMAFAWAGASTSLVDVLTQLAAGTDDPEERLAIETDLLTARIWAPPGAVDVEAVHATATRFAAAAPIAAARLLTVLSLGLVITGRPDEAPAQLAAARAFASDDDVDPELLLTWDVIDLHLGGSGGDVLGGSWAEELTDRELTAPSLAIISATTALIWADSPARARALLQRQYDALVTIGALGQLGLCHGLLAAALVREGDWLAARAHFAQAIALCADTDLRGPLPHIQIRSAYLHAALGHTEACQTLLTEARATSHGSPVVAHLDACVFGLLALGEGRCADAAELLAGAGRWEREAGVLSPGYSSRAGDLADALWRLRRLDALESVVADLEDRAQRADRAGPLAVAARSRALLAEADDIDAAFTRALDWHQQSEDVFEEARTQLSWGRRLRRARRKRDARPHLRAALDCFEQLGAVPWATQARSELAACGERRVPGRAVAADLTPRELEVAVVVARGASNPEAAAELCISRRTVEDHLGHIYRKLGVRDRTALAAALAEPDPHA